MHSLVTDRFGSASFKRPALLGCISSIVNQTVSNFGSRRRLTDLFIFQICCFVSNEDDSEGNTIENKGQISDFSPHPRKKLENEWKKMSECHFQRNLGPILWYTLAGVVLGELGD